MKLFTIQVSKKRLADMPVEDISQKNASPHVKTPTPDWEMIDGYLCGRLTEKEYHDKYFEVLDRHQEVLLNYFRGLSDMMGYTKLAIACECKPGAFCRRILLAEWLSQKLGWEYCGELGD